MMQHWWEKAHCWLTTAHTPHQGQLLSKLDLKLVKTLEEQERENRTGNAVYEEMLAAKERKAHQIEADLLANHERTERVQDNKHHDAMGELLSKTDLKVAKTLEEQERLARLADPPRLDPLSDRVLADSETELLRKVAAKAAREAEATEQAQRIQADKLHHALDELHSKVDLKTVKQLEEEVGAVRVRKFIL